MVEPLPLVTPEVRRLGIGDRALARRLFAMMADVFAEPTGPLSDCYLDGLLVRDGFWPLVAFEGAEVIGGLTAHTLPLTRTEAVELFVYDVAVRADRQRRGVGRALMAAASSAVTMFTFAAGELGR